MDIDDWTRETEELERRRFLARRMGGEKNVASQHAKGKLTARERLSVLCDEGSFRERGVLSGITYCDENDAEQARKIIPCPLILGVGKINGRRVALHADDFTVKGASVGRMYKAKREYFAQMARSLKLPMIRLVEGAGGSIREIMDIGYTEMPAGNPGGTQNEAEALSEVPVVAAGLGPMAGLGALFMVKSHFSVMVAGQAQIFVGGPPLVESAFGQKVSKDELGGHLVHARVSGVVDNEAANELDAFEQIRAFLSYLPPNVWEMPERVLPSDDSDRQEEALISAVPRDPRKSYDMRKLLGMVLDLDSFFEIGKEQGRSQITGLARLDGYPVGVLANDPRFLGGSFNYDVAEKFQRFVDMCDTFHLPIVNFCDQPGFSIGLESERMGTIRKGVRASFAMVQATIPVAVIYIKKCYGVAGAAQRPARRFCWQAAWPSARWGNIPVEGGVFAAHRTEIESSPDPDACLRQLQEEYKAIASPFRTAAAFGVEDIIDPRETRPMLCEWVKDAYGAEKYHLGPKKRGMRC